MNSIYTHLITCKDILCVFTDGWEWLQTGNVNTSCHLIYWGRLTISPIHTSSDQCGHVSTMVERGQVLLSSHINHYSACMFELESRLPIKLSDYQPVLWTRMSGRQPLSTITNHQHVSSIIKRHLPSISTINHHSLSLMIWFALCHYCYWWTEYGLFSQTHLMGHNIISLYGAVPRSL